MKKVLSILIILEMAALGAAEKANDVVTVAIPPTQNSLSTLKAETVSKEKKFEQLEINVSSYAPSKFETTSQLSETSRFTRGNLGSLSVSMNLPLKKDFFFSFGFGLDEFKRNGVLLFNNVGATQDQTVYMASLRTGIQYFYSRGTWFSPYATVLVLPAVTFSENSSFGDGASGTGIPLEYGAGAALTLSRLGKSFSETWLNLGFLGRYGKVAGGSVNGTGWLIGARVGL